MPRFQGRSWSIDLLPEWVGEQEEECSTIYLPNGVGSLQISAYIKNTPVTEEDLKDFASEHIEAGAKHSPANCGVFKGFTLSFGIENTFWQHWYVAFNNVTLFITYNCIESGREHEINQVKEMVATLAAT